MGMQICLDIRLHLHWQPWKIVFGFASFKQKYHKISLCKWIQSLFKSEATPFTKELWKYFYNSYNQNHHAWQSQHPT